MRRWLFKLHSWIGLAGALGLVIIGLTGSLLVFSEDLDRVLHPVLFYVAPQSEKLPLDILLARVRSAFPDHKVNGIDLSEWDQPEAALVVSLNQVEQYPQAHLNPYTGEILALRETTFFHWLLKLHYTFFLNDWGMALAFVFAVILMLSSLSGFVIFRDWAARVKQPARWRRSARVALSDLHKIVGVATLGFNLVLGFTGAWMNYGAFERAVKGQPRPARTYPLISISLDQALAACRNALPEIEPTWISFPRQEKDLLRVLGRMPGACWSIFGPYSSSVQFDPHTGGVRQVVDIRRTGPRKKFEALIVPLHFCNFGGMPIKILYCIGGLAPGLLATTGCMIWWTRTRRAKSQKLTDDFNTTAAVPTEAWTDKVQ
jgi:uncharacterized iron-regulated membrane protein